MEYIVGLLLAALGGVFYFKGKADKAAVDAKLANLKGRDTELKKKEEELNEMINIVDEGLKLVEEKKEEAKKKRKHMSLKERRDLSNKRFGKK